MNVIGISRSKEYSPNMADADAAILSAVAEEIVRRGHSVRLLSDKEWAVEASAAAPGGATAGPAGGHPAHLGGTTAATGVLPDRVFTMSRTMATCRSLAALEQESGLPVVNSALGIVVCSNRRLLTERLLQAGMPIPATRFADSEEGVSISGPTWMKRLDGYSQEATDVVLVNSQAEALAAYRQFAARGISEVCLSRHTEGDLVKFYGVAGTPFFHWSYAADGHSKFGWEASNGQPVGYSFSAEALKSCCDAFALSIGVPVYGGDCIVAADGTAVIIDFNDWPSYSRCREAAARAIAQCILQTGTNQANSR